MLDYKLNFIERLIKSEDVKVISFDIFDTLVYRPTIYPTDIFYLVSKQAKALNIIKKDFYQTRLALEDQARKLYKKNKETDEITLDEIYQALEKKHGYSKEIANKLKQIEIDIEVQLIQPSQLVKKLYLLAKEHSKKIIITSDMYLPQNVIEKILENTGYNGYDKLYLSSEVGKNKRSGELFKHILSELKADIKPDEILHIGDNLQSDIKQAEKCGILTHHVPQAVDIFFANSEWVKIQKEHIPLDNRFLFGQQIHSLLLDSDQPFDDNSLFCDSHYNMGWFSIAPILMKIANTAHNDPFFNKYEKLYFAARDGYLPQKAYDILAKYYPNAIPSEYLYVSRQSYKFNTFTGNLKTYISQWPSHDYLKVTNEQMLIAYFNKKFIADFQQELKIMDLDDKYDAKTIMRFLKINTAKIHEFIEQEKHIEKSSYMEYFQDDTSDRLCIFDIGYSGSVSNALTRILNKSVDKYYLMVNNPKNNKLDTKNKTKTLSLIDHIVDEINVFLEEIFSKIEGSCESINFIDGVLNTSLENIPISSSMENDLNLIHIGAIDCIEKFSSIFKNLLSLINHDVMDMARFLQYFNSDSKIKDYKLLENIVYPDKTLNLSYSLYDKLSFRKKDLLTNSSFFHLDNFYKEDCTDIYTHDKSLAIHLHLYNTEMFDYFYKYFEKIPYEFDLLVSVSNLSTQHKSQLLFPMIENMKNLTVRISENKGRDVAPWIILFNDIINDYDYVVHLHSKKSSHFTWHREWLNYLLENLITPVALSANIKILTENNNIGVISPPLHYKLVNNWFSVKGVNNCEKTIIDLLQKLNINTLPTQHNMKFSTGTMFIYKACALKPYFTVKLTYEDFEDEPLKYVDGYLPHAIEKTIGIVANSQNYEFIYNIPNQHEKNKMLIKLESVMINSPNRFKMSSLSKEIPVYIKQYLLKNCPTITRYLRPIYRKFKI